MFDTFIIMSKILRADIFGPSVDHCINRNTANLFF